MRLSNPSQGRQKTQEYPSHPIPAEARRLPHVGQALMGQEGLGTELTRRLRPWARDAVLSR